MTARAGFNLAQYTRDVIALIQQLNPPVVLLGHSYGGATAAQVAIERPDLVSKLVLAEAATYGVLSAADQQGGALMRAMFADRTEEVLKAGGATGAAEFTMDTINGTGLFAKLPPTMRSVSADDAWTAVACGRDKAPTASCEQLVTLQMPVLLVTGQSTSPGFHRLVARQGECIRGARTITIPGVRHSMQMNAAALNEALKEFVR